MGLFDSIGSIIQTAASFVGSLNIPVVSSVANVIAGSKSTANQQASTVTDSISSLLSSISSSLGNGLGSVLSGISSGIGSGLSALTTGIGSVIGGISSAVGSGLSALGSGTSSVLASINGLVNSLRGTTSGILAPIVSLINQVAATARNINDNLITPIVVPIETVVKTSQDLIAAIHGDLGAGLQGILKLPGDIANALTNIDASFQRAMQQLATQNADIVEKLLKPALYESGKVPLGDIHTTMAAYTALFGKDIGYVPELILSKPPDAVQFEAKNWQIVQALQSGTTWYEKLGYMFFSLFALPEWVHEQNAPLLEEIGQLTWKSNPTKVLDVGDAIAAYWRGIITKDQMYEECLRFGLDKSRIDALVELEIFLPSPEMALVWRARGVIDDAALVGFLKQHNFTDDDITAFKQGELEIPRLGDVSELMGRINAQKTGFLSASLNSPIPPEVQKSAQDNYVQGDATQYAWLKHWRIPPAAWWVEAVWRGIRTKEEAYNAFAAENIPQEVWEDIFSVETKLLELWLVPDIIASGAGDDAYWLDYMRKLGFDDATGQIVIQYGKSKSKATKVTTANDLQHLSLTNAATLYDDGVITKDDYSAILEAHGYGPESTALTIELADIKNAQAARKAYADGLVTDVQLGLVPIDVAVADLGAQGFTQVEVATYQQKMLNVLKTTQKMPSKADIDKMYKLGLITATDWENAMLRLGYGPNWIPLMLQLV